MNRGCSLLLVVGVLASFGVYATEANLGVGGTNISTFNIDNKQHAEIDAKYDSDWHRLSNGSIDMKLHKEYVLKKYNKIKDTLRVMCTAISVGNLCQPYYLAIEKDLNKFLGEMGRFLKFYDQALVKLRRLKEKKIAEEAAKERIRNNVVNENNPSSLAPEYSSGAPDNQSPNYEYSSGASVDASAAPDAALPPVTKGPE